MKEGGLIKNPVTATITVQLLQYLTVLDVVLP